MTSPLSRRRFVQVAAGSCGVLATNSLVCGQATTQSPAASKPVVPNLDKGPTIDLELVRKTVGASHRDLAAVKSLVTADPELANGCWDWGGGDYETPLGASAHTGQTEIARFLLNNGARLDVFASAMLGMLPVVKAAIEADETTRYCLGPHGFTLMHHAEVGEKQSLAVVEYLTDLYANDKSDRNIPLSPRWVQHYVGRFAPEIDSSQEIEVIAGDRALQMRTANLPAVALANRGNHVFATTSGAMPMTLQFGLQKTFAQTVSISMDGKTIEAVRVTT